VFFPVFAGGPLAVALSVCSFLSCGTCIFAGYQTRARKMSLKHNLKLSKLIHELEYAASSSEALSAKDFVTLFRENVLDECLVGDLSFTQIRDIKKICVQLDIENPIKQEGERIQRFIHDHWNYRQKAPWERMNMIETASLEDLYEILSDDYIRTRIEDSPGFLEEFVTVLSETIGQSTDAQRIILDNIRDIVIREFSYEFTDEEILRAMQSIAEGGDFESCFRLVMTQDRIVTLTCGMITIDLSASALSNASKYFRGRLDFDREMSEVIFEDLSEEDFEVFIQYLQGKKIPINVENVDHFLSIANYFEIPSLAEACQTPMLLKYEAYDLESKLQLLEDFSILKGRFQDHVDEECAKEFLLSDHKTFCEQYTRMDRLELLQTKNAMVKALYHEIDRWAKETAYTTSFEHFVEKINEYHSYFPWPKPLKKKIIEIIHKRLESHDEELPGWYKMVLSNPNSLFVSALYNFVSADQYQDQVYSTFLSVNSVKETLEQMKGTFDSDQKLISRIKKWDGEGSMRESFDEFIAQILDYRSSIQTDAYRKRIEELLIGIIRSRVANTDIPSELSALEARAHDDPFLKQAL